MPRLLRLLLTGVTLVGIVFAAFVVGHEVRARSAVSKACSRAEPLVARRANRQKVIGRLGPAMADQGAADLPKLERLFASPPVEAATLRGWLTGTNRVLIYTTAEYIMFIHFEGGDAAVEVRCFAQ